MTGVAEINPDAVLQFEQVTVRRGGKLLLDAIDWTVEVDERWAVLGPNGAGKTTLLQIAAAMLHPTSGTAYLFGERLGAVDVFELRPRIGFASAALAQRIPNGSGSRDVVVSAGYAVLGRWREDYGRPRRPPGAAPAGPLGGRRAGRAHLRHAVRGRAQAGADRPGADDRPRAAAAGRAGGRHGPRRPRGPAGPAGRLAADPDAPASILVTHHVEEIPPGFTHVLLLREGRVVGGGPGLRRAHGREPVARRSGCACRAASGRRWYARARE